MYIYIYKYNMNNSNKKERKWISTWASKILSANEDSNLNNAWLK